MRRFLLAGLLLVLTVFALPHDLEAQAKKRGDRNRITTDDMAEASGTMNTAFDVIRTMRPQWLSPSRGRTSNSNMDGGVSGGATEVVIYIDDNRQPSIEVLQTVKASSVVEMRYLEQNRAIQMRGPGHEKGVIEITTTARKP